MTVDCILRARALVRRGNFIAAATDPKLIADLEAIRGDDPTANQRWLTGCALRAEINDQTGQYESAAEIFTSLPETVIRGIHRKLKEAENEYSKRLTPSISDDERRLLRARALFLLQFGIHKLRRCELDSALTEMVDCQMVLESVMNPTVRFHGVLSLLHYWQGRVQMARNRSPEALDHFNASMRQTEKNLEFHYSGTPADDERIAYGVYSLASCMAFGVAHLNHISGHLAQALELLRPASAMLMGTGDNYRRGYAQMLTGAAERALAGRNTKRLRAAIDVLEESLRLFAGDVAHTLQHRLHQARVHYQVGIAKLYLAQTYASGSAEKESNLTHAKNKIYLATSVLSEFAGAGFPDPELQYDLSITESRILRELGEYEPAGRVASRALRMAEDYQYAPTFSQAKALVALAEIPLSQLDTVNADQSGKLQLLDRAQGYLSRASGKCGSNLPLLAVVNLYEAKILVRRGQIPKASQKFHEGWWHRAEKQIQNGWVRQLATEVESELQQPDAEFTLNLDHLKTELLKKKEEDGDESQSLWKEAIYCLQSFMINWAQKNRRHSPWEELNISKSSFYKVQGVLANHKTADKET